MASFEIDETMVDVPVAGGSFRAFRAIPKGAGAQPGVIVVHEFHGLNGHIRDVTRRLAREGYVSLGVDLFSRAEDQPDPTDTQALFRRMQKLPDEEAVEDLVAAENYLHSIPQVGARRVGAIGFSLGGTYTYLLGCADTMVRAVAVFYGTLVYATTNPLKPISPAEKADNLHCALLGLFGAEDPVIPVEQVREFEERLRGLGKDFEIHVYPGCGHAFFNDTRENYRPEAARDAWAKTIRFLAKHLRA
jgi:carboxymethylenebutenolidase